jgi:disulfide bond formation protein DsbB
MLLTRRRAKINRRDGRAAAPDLFTAQQHRHEGCKTAFPTKFPCYSQAMTRTIHLNMSMLVLAGMIAVIAAVLGFQHIGGYIPCKLCLEQRQPYYAGMPVVALAALSAWRGWPGWITRTLLAAGGVLLLASMALAIYHSGVEWHWWAGPTDCGATAGNISADVNDLLGDLSTRPPSCDKAAGRFLGLSFAGWNVIASGLLAAMALRAAAAPAQGSSTLSQ